MADDRWAAGLNMDPKLVKRFNKLSKDLRVPAVELVAAMVARVVETDDHVQLVGLKGLGAFTRKENRTSFIANLAMNALPTDIRPTGCMWPAHIPFPWTAEECKAAVIGYQVRWPGSAFDFMDRIRGSWELSEDDYAVLLRRRRDGAF